MSDTAKPWTQPMPDAQFKLMRDILAAPSPVGREGAMTYGVLKPYFESFAPSDWHLHQFKGNAGVVLDTHPGRDDMFKLMIIGHADKIRMQVRSIGEDGKIWINTDSFLPGVLIGWSFSYLWKMLTGGLAGTSVDEMAAVFGANNANPITLGSWSTLVTLLTMIIVGKGVQEGIEKSVSWMMPGLVLMLVLLIGFGMFSGGFGDAVDFLFSFKAGSLSSEGMLAALGHAFFTLSLASGAILTYGSYLPKDASIGRTTLSVAVADTVVALMAGLAIFPVIFANGMDPGEGPGLLFMSLPLAFQAMPLGTLFGALFFLMLSMAALTSSISMVEATVSWLCDNKGMSRKSASWATGIVLWLISTLAMLSFNLGADWTLAGKNFFDWLDYLTSRWMMPLGGLGMVLLAGFVLKSETFRDELGLAPLPYTLWLAMVRYVSPLGILVIFVDALGLYQISFAAHWPVLLALLVLIAVVGEAISPRLRQALSAR